MRALAHLQAQGLSHESWAFFRDGWRSPAWDCWRGCSPLRAGALAQTTMHKNGFEAKLGFSKGGTDAVFDEIVHKIDDREPHNGQGCEFIDLDVKQGKFIYYVYPIGKAPISEELRAALWLRANRPRHQADGPRRAPQSARSQQCSERADHLHRKRQGQHLRTSRAMAAPGAGPAPSRSPSNSSFS